MQVFATSKVPVLGRALNQIKYLFTKYRMAVRIMKMTGIILLMASLQLSAKGISQSISLSVNDAPLQKVFQLIEKQTDYVFFVSKEWLDKARNVTIQVSNMSLHKVLDMCFKGQPLTYSISGKIITIAPRASFASKDGNIISQDNANSIIDIKGRIINVSGDPVSSATVSVKGGSKTTLTNANGEFWLYGIDEKAILIISHVQYESVSVSINGKDFINSTLQIKVGALDELQVIAYGVTTRRFNTGNISSVKSADIEKQPINNPLLALVGRVPGLYITQANGLPGTGVTVRIQGQNSLLTGSDPLYVIDGVPYVSQLLPTISSVLGTSGGPSLNGVAPGSGNPLTFINPADIESIEVLKDADATSIYGSRAAAGAILITTKKGKAGKTQVNVNLQNGWGKVSKKMDLLNTEQYIEMRKEAFQNDGIPIPNMLTTPGPANYDLTVWEDSRYTNWQDVLIGGTAKYRDVQTSISGGSSNLQFMIAPGYHKETTVFPGDLQDERGSLHFNMNSMSANQKFKILFSGSFMTDNNRLQKKDLTNIAITLPPNAPLLFNPDGTLNWAHVNGVSTWDNPLSNIYGKYQFKAENLLSNISISYQVFSGLDFKSSFGYNSLRTTEVALSPLLVFKPEERAMSTRSALFGNSSVRSWIIEPQASYTLSFGRSKLEALIGATFNKRLSEMVQQSGAGYSSDVVMEDIKSAPSIVVNSTLDAVYNYNALFGRFNFMYSNKYVVNFTARRDGSSRFGENNLFQNFWSLGGAWIFSQEKLVQKYLNFLSFGKFRASYGTTGNEQIGDYRFMNLYSAITAAAPYLGVTGLQANSLPNPDVQWEETRKFQAGIDLGFLNNRILVTANIYNNTSSNQLLSYPLPLITGFNNIASYNLPAKIKNSGWEFSLQTRNVQSKEFTWSTNFNLTIPRNKLVNYPDLVNSALASILVVGEPFTLTKVYPFLGVDSQTGLYIVSDSNGNATSNPNQLKDKTVFVNNSPELYGGIENSFSYKEFGLDFLFQFVKQKGANYMFGNFPGFPSNQPTAVLNRWQKNGDEQPSIQKYSQSNINVIRAQSAAIASDKAYGDASFIRLKNLSLSWRIPGAWTKKTFIAKGKLYAQGQNLLTITKYLGLDPETKSVNNLPPIRIITFGIQVTF